MPDFKHYSEEELRLFIAAEVSRIKAELEYQKNRKKNQEFHSQVMVKDMREVK